MEAMVSLWLPIVLSAAAVWVMSALVWMVMPHHKKDFIGLGSTDEDALMAFIRERGIKAGNYGYPDCHSAGAMKSEKVRKAWVEGPVGQLSVWKTPLTMGDKMVATFVVYLVVSALIGQLTSVAVPMGAGGVGGVEGAGASFGTVFRFAAGAGVLAYCFSFIPSAIWWGAYKRTIVANVVDGVAYAAITGAMFAWLWPR